MTKRNADADPTATQFQAFQRMFDYFNAALFGGTLPPVLLNFSRAANTLGFFAPERWEREGEKVAHEISLNPAYLKHRDQRDVVSTLVHEMAHHWQQEFGTPGRRGYHNEEWAAKMETLGLMPSSTAAPGGARVGYKVSHYILDGGAFALAYAKMPREHLLPWLCWEGTERAKKPRQPSKVRFTCPDCGCNAWGKPTLRIACTDCDTDMVATGATDGDEQACSA
jgi:hypothetical protein